jgi:thymidylate synthase
MGNQLDKKYQQLLSDIIAFGVEKKDRTGTGTISEFGHQIRHKMSEGFPLLTTKKMAWKQIVSELLWFLTGQTNIAFLHKHNNHIWDGDAYKNYLKNHPNGYYTDQHEVDGLIFTGPSVWKDEEPLSKEQFINKIKTDDGFVKTWGDLGPIYGKQWRKWDGKNGRIDQIDNLVRELKTNPDSRRLVVSAWNVGELDQMVLPPCHYGFQVWTREEDGKRYISLMWNQRSVDTFLGLPFNIASYGLLLHIIANEVDMIPDELIGNLGDTHLYLNHIEQAKEQISRDSFDLPTLKTNAKMDGICCNVPDDFVLEGYQYHPTIKAPLSN